MRLERPTLREGEELWSETEAESFGTRPWQSRSGRLFLTNERIFFLPTVARVLPRWPFSPPKLEIELGTIETVEYRRLTLRVIWDRLTIELLDGRHFRFSVWDGLKLHDDILRFRDSITLSQTEGDQQSL